MGKKRAQGKKLPKINSCVVWEKGKSFSLTTHANRIDYCLRVKKEKVPGTRSFVFIFRRSRARARASNRLRVRSVKILSKTVRSREGKRKKDKHQPNRFFIASCRKDLKFPPSIREGEKRKRIAGKRRRPFSSLEDFSRVRVWWLFRFKRTTKRTRKKVFLGALDFFLSLRKKRQNKNRFFTRSWFCFN